MPAASRKYIASLASGIGNKLKNILPMNNPVRDKMFSEKIVWLVKNFPTRVLRDIRNLFQVFCIHIYC